MKKLLLLLTISVGICAMEKNENSSAAAWNLLPQEVKAHILAFIPGLFHYNLTKSAIGKLFLVNHEFKDLVSHPPFLRTVLREFAAKNLDKVFDIDELAMEQGNIELAQLAFRAIALELSKLIKEEKINQKNPLQADLNQSVEPFSDEPVNEEDWKEEDIITLIKVLPREAIRVFCIAAAVGNKELVTLFLDAQERDELQSKATELVVEYWDDLLSFKEAAFTGNRLPLKRAAAYGHEDIVTLLIKNGADINCSRDCWNKMTYMFDGNVLKYGATVLMDAVIRNDKEMTKFLLEQGAECNTRDTLSHTALLFAAQLNHKEIAELLLAHKADINLSRRSGVSALMLAAKEGHQEMVKLLLAHGANPFAKTQEGETAATFAAKNGHQEIVAILPSTYCLIS